MFNIHAIIILIRSIFHALDKYKIHQIQSRVLKISQDANNKEFLIIGTQKQCGKLDCFFPTPVLSQNFTPAISARNLGIT